MEQEHRIITELLAHLDKQCGLKEHIPGGARLPVLDGASTPRRSTSAPRSILSAHHSEDGPAAPHTVTATGGAIPRRRMESSSAGHGPTSEVRGAVPTPLPHPPSQNTYKLPRYAGITPLEPYLAQVEMAALMNRWNAAETAAHIVLALEGKALQVLMDVAPGDQPTESPTENINQIGRLGRAHGLYLLCYLNGHACRALVDSGSVISLVRPGVLPETSDGESSGWAPTSNKIRTVTGGLSEMLGKRSLRARAGRTETEQEFWLADILDPCIIGLDLLEHWGAVVDQAYGCTLKSATFCNRKPSSWDM
uniref:Peptidase A2 domain-containing protein n=1 Tax=Sphaeramia orbicularis TaxID=375764 RepID=A0A672ZJH5_9TELE